MQTRTEEERADIRVALNNEIHEAIMRIHINPTCIVMHPLTWEKIVTMPFDFSSDTNPYGSDLRFNGIKVYRSIDIQEDEFKIG